MKKLILLSTIAILFSSCTYVYFQDLANVGKGMSLDKVIETLESDDYDDGIIELNSFDEDVYDVGGNTKVMLALKYQPPQYFGTFAFLQNWFDEPHAYYLFAFENDKLIYWGLPIDFYKTGKDKLEKIADQANDIINKEYEN